MEISTKWVGRKSEYLAVLCSYYFASFTAKIDNRNNSAAVGGWLLYTSKSSSATGRTRHRLGNTCTCLYDAFQHIAKSPSSAGRTRHRLGNTSTCQYYVFRHITKSSSAAGRTRYQKTHYWQCLHCQAKVVRPAADDNFVICQNAHYWQCLYCQANVVRPAADDDFALYIFSVFSQNRAISENVNRY